VEQCERIAKRVMTFDDERQVFNFLRDEMNMLLGADL
jgi:hypothetical protein